MWCLRRKLKRENGSVIEQYGLFFLFLEGMEKLSVGRDCTALFRNETDCLSTSSSEEMRSSPSWVCAKRTRLYPRCTILLMIVRVRDEGTESQVYHRCFLHDL